MPNWITTTVSALTTTETIWHPFQQISAAHVYKVWQVRYIITLFLHTKLVVTTGYGKKYALNSKTIAQKNLVLL